ncbi:hypothetical protein FQN54_006155 [Arachnomyces sp. PD_36]|nr:hypothetical protein FQN54_006155 [Arachnomyces sp. PD_36]
MSFSVCRAWSSLFLSTLERRATFSYQYLPPGHSCAVDYPTKVKPNGAQSHIYSHIHTSADQGPLYAVDVAIVGCYGEGRFLEATFVVPSLEPLAPLHDYDVEYDTFLEVYVVSLVPREAPEGPIPSVKAPASTMEQADADDWFHAEYMDFEEYYDDDWESYDAQICGGLFPVENFPVMSQNVNPEPAPTIDNLDSPDREIFNSSSEEETKSNAQITSREDKLAELLRPDNFDWAEEVDEEIVTYRTQEQPLRNQEPDPLKQESFNWAEDVEEEEARPGTMDHRSGDEGAENDRGSPYAPFIVDSSQCSSNGTSSQPPPGSCEAQETDSLSSDTEGIHEAEAEMSEHSQDEQEAKERAEQESKRSAEAVRQVFQFRKYPHIHHFNWLGYGVFGPSETPPEVSLMVLMSDSKVWRNVNAAFREVTVLRNAFIYVDPVLYTGDPAALGLRGSELSRVVTGFTSKFYSPYGTWDDDSYDGDEERPIADPIDNPEAVAMHIDKPWVPINGWFCQNVAPTRDVAVYQFSSDWGGDKERYFEKKARPYQMSRLRISQSAAEEDDGESSQYARDLRVVHGSMQYWTHDGGLVLNETLSAEAVGPDVVDAASTPEVVERVDLDGDRSVEPTEGQPPGPDYVDLPGTTEEAQYDEPPSGSMENADDGDSGLSHSRTSSSVTSRAASSELTRVTTNSSTEEEPSPRPASCEMVTHPAGRRSSLQDPRLETVPESSSHLSEEIEEGESSSTDVILPLVVPPRIPRPLTLPSTTNPATNLPPKDKNPAPKLVRPDPKSAQVKTSLNTERPIPVFSTPDPETSSNPRKQVWTRAWGWVTGAARRVSLSKPRPPPPPSAAAQILQRQLRSSPSSP